MSDPMSRLAGLLAGIEATLRRAAQGEMVDLARLPPELEAICREIAALPPQRAAEHAALLRQAVAALDDLRDGLSPQAEAVAERLRALEAAGR